MIRRTFLKCCVSAALAVGAFYGGMGIPDFLSTPKLDSFSESELNEIMSQLIETLPLGSPDTIIGREGWKVIQNFKGGEAWSHIDGELMCLSRP